MVELGLDRLGYRYLVLDGGCYRLSRADGKPAADILIAAGFEQVYAIPGIKQYDYGPLEET